MKMKCSAVLGMHKCSKGRSCVKLTRILFGRDLKLNWKRERYNRKCNLVLSFYSRVCWRTTNMVLVYQCWCYHHRHIFPFRLVLEQLSYAGECFTAQGQIGKHFFGELCNTRVLVHPEKWSFKYIYMSGFIWQKDVLCIYSECFRLHIYKNKSLWKTQTMEEWNIWICTTKWNSCRIFQSSIFHDIGGETPCNI